MVQVRKVLRKSERGERRERGTSEEELTKRESMRKRVVIRAREIFNIDPIGISYLPSLRTYCKQTHLGT